MNGLNGFEANDSKGHGSEDSALHIFEGINYKKKMKIFISYFSLKIFPLIIKHLTFFC